VDAGANVDARNNGNGTALMYASYDGHASVVRMLLDAGADVDARNVDNGTALMHASQNGHASVGN